MEAAWHKAAKQGVQTAGEDGEAGPGSACCPPSAYPLQAAGAEARVPAGGMEAGTGCIESPSASHGKPVALSSPCPALGRLDRKDTGWIWHTHCPVAPNQGCPRGTDPPSVQARRALAKPEPLSSHFSPRPEHPASPGCVPLPCRTCRRKAGAGGMSPCLSALEMPKIRSLCTADQPPRSGADIKQHRSPWVPQLPSSQQPSKNHHSSDRPRPPRLTILAWSCSVVPKAVPKSPGPTLARIPDPTIQLCCRGTTCLLLHRAQELPRERCRVAPPIQTPIFHLENTLPWDRPPWGSSGPEENEGKSGPHSPPRCSYAGNCHAHSPGLVPLLPVLPTTVPVFSQHPAHTHSGQGPPSPLEFHQQPWCRGELCPLHPPPSPATAGPSQGDLGDKNLLSCCAHASAKPTGGNTATQDRNEGEDILKVTQQRWGVALLHHPHTDGDQPQAPSGLSSDLAGTWDK